MKKTISFLPLFFFLNLSIFSQIDSTTYRKFCKKNNKYGGFLPIYPWQGQGGVLFALQHGKSWTGEIGYVNSDVLYTTIKEYKSYFFNTDPRNVIGISSEFNFEPDSFIIGPKITYQYAWILFLFTGKISATYYTDFSKGEFRISPSFGLSLGFLDILYNYNFEIGKSYFPQIGRNRISIDFYLTRKG